MSYTNSSKQITSSNKPHNLYRTTMLALLTFLLLIGIVSVLEITNVTYFFHKRPVEFRHTPTIGGASTNNLKGESQSSTNSGNSTSNSSSSASNSPTSNQSVGLISPSGDFVSNHTPGQNGSSLIETSVCNTTPGARCQISFTLNGRILDLPSETTDLGGSAYWNDWTPQSVGLTPGTWQITASATLGSQTKTTADPRSLVVTQ